MHEEKASSSAEQTPDPLLDDMRASLRRMIKAGRDLPDDVLDARIASVTQKFLDEPEEPTPVEPAAERRRDSERLKQLRERRDDLESGLSGMQSRVHTMAVALYAGLDSVRTGRGPLDDICWGIWFQLKDLDDQIERLVDPTPRPEEVGS